MDKCKNNMNSQKRNWNDFSPCEICLINPPWITKKGNIWHGIKASLPPLSILTIAAYLEERGLNVAIIDVHAEGLTIDELKKRILKLKPKIIGITVMTATAVQSNLIARLAKEMDPAVVVVTGGVHADVLPEECLSNRCVDIVVRGDGEITFYYLCEAILNGGSYKNISGISFRDTQNGKKRVIHNPPAEIIKDINHLPMPSYHLVPMHLYHPAIGSYRKLPAINMLMTRGCPGKCSFCNSAKTPLRTRDAEIVVEEILKLKSQYGIKEVQFYDDTFTVFRQNVLKFCKLMRKKDVNVGWVAFSRVDCIDEQIARAMKDAGCHQIMFGVESGDPDVLKKMGKPILIRQTEKAVQIVRNAGIEVRCAFVYGCEGETAVSMQKTLDLALRLDSDLAIFNIATPYPGTGLFNWAKANGYLMHEDWMEYELGQPVIQLPTVSPEQVMEFYRKSFRMFYFHPKAVWRRLKKTTSIYHWMDMIRFFIFLVSRCKMAWGNKTEEWGSFKKENFFDYFFVTTQVPAKTNK